jgi:hypothetical protein
MALPTSPEPPVTRIRMDAWGSPILAAPGGPNSVRPRPPILPYPIPPGNGQQAQNQEEIQDTGPSGLIHTTCQLCPPGRPRLRDQSNWSQLTTPQG